MKRFFSDDLDDNISRSISQAIKRERLEQNLTLESIAKGICSLSYLSKIENFTIIPHASYLEALCERLNIDFDKIIDAQRRNDLNEVLKFYLYEMYSNIEEAYLALENPYYNVNDSLIKIVYHLYKGNFTEVEKEIKYVNEVRSTLTVNEANILTLLVAEYYIKTNQFKKIEDKLDLLIQISRNASPIQTLYFEQIFIASYHLDIKYLMYRFYYLLNNYKISNYPSWRLFKIQVMMIEVQSRDKHNYSLEKLSTVCLNNSMQIIEEELVYYRALIYINQEKYKEAYEQLSVKDSFTAREFALLIYSAYMGETLNNEELISLAKSFDFSPYEHAHKNFVNYVVLKIEGIRRTELAEVLKYHMLPSNKLSPFPIYSRIYLEELLKLGFRNSYYRLIKKYFPR